MSQGYRNDRSGGCLCVLLSIAATIAVLDGAFETAMVLAIVAGVCAVFA